MKLNFDITLTRGQQEAYDLIHRDEVQTLVLRWSRQCGKSIFAEIMLIEYLLKKNTFNCYVSPTFSLGKKVFSEILRLLGPTGMVKKSNAQDLTIETTTDSMLKFFSTEAYQSIRGHTISGIMVLDECAYFPDQFPNGELPWANVLMPLTKARNPKVLVISTPRGKRGMFWDFWQKAVRREKGVYCLTRTIKDDDLVTPEQVKEIRRGMPEKAFRQEFMVEFIDDAMSFFQGFDRCFVRTLRLNTARTYIGVDYSAKGEDRTIVTVVDDDGNVVQHLVDNDSLEERCKAIAQIINRQKDMASCYLEQNGIGAPLTEMVLKNVKPEFRRRCRDWNTTNSSKERIISRLAVEIANRTVRFEEADRDLYNELGDFVCHYSKTGKQQFEAKSGHDDRVMSLAIALAARDNVPSSYEMGRNVSFIQSNQYILR